MKDSVTLDDFNGSANGSPASVNPVRSPEKCGGRASGDGLVAAFEACTLPPADFGHAEHVRLAWAYLEHTPLPVAAARLCAGLKRYTRAVGAAGKYHETVTLAWLFLVDERRRRAGDGDWPAFRRANPDLFDPSARPLAAWYRPETLRSARARRRFVLPDVDPAESRGADRRAGARRR
jgi:hypothetical protein